MKKILINLAFNFLVVFSLWAQQPTDSKKIDINDLSGKDVPQVMEEIKKEESGVTDKDLDSAVSELFSGNQEEAIGSAINVLRSPRIQLLDGRRFDHTSDLRVARTILYKFNDKAMQKLESEFNSGNAELRGNIIKVAGQMSDEERISPMLLSALDDKSYCEKEDPELEGEAMRVCDHAYNQMVLRYHIKGLLRTIGPIHRVEVRDSNIKKLKGLLYTLEEKK